MRGQMGNGLGDVEVDVPTLIEILEKNRTEHRTAFEQACVAFQEKGIQALKQMTTALIDGKIQRLWVTLPVPEEHTADYDRAIMMLKMHHSPTIEISEEAFARLVQDEWGWRQEFLANTMSYLGSAQND